MALMHNQTPQCLPRKQSLIQPLSVQYIFAATDIRSSTYDFRRWLKQLTIWENLKYMCISFGGTLEKAEHDELKVYCTNIIYGFLFEIQKTYPSKYAGIVC